ncbi:MAG: type 4a pilus biogenesis protein PilO [Candidatus Marinimicrobia bacterium]|nr:type 4a pilus biogenesis protein PilO [Candidatus Neomarinimicrobiota bacterium]MCF7840784.1 type 4a pilus biogenesis protein PilO [Candidatus Neomarinimicrobiota bacterium]MCF7902149.1 type 4a pilus biogenesis protein PilO [Candidatus Neomarinimicrobiota bacterium]
MKRAQYLLIIIFLAAAGFYYGLNFVYASKPGDIRYLNREIDELNEKLITAQILANKLDRVYTLFEENLALSAKDSLAEDASMPFLNSITEKLDQLGITLLNIRPRPSMAKGRYISTPYELEIQCNYNELGALMAELERSERLITVEEFLVKNDVARLKTFRDAEQLLKQSIEMRISTLTLIKGKSNG